MIAPLERIHIVVEGTPAPQEKVKEPPVTTKQVYLCEPVTLNGVDYKVGYHTFPLDVATRLMASGPKRRRLVNGVEVWAPVAPLAIPAEGGGNNQPAEVITSVGYGIEVHRSRR